MQSVLEQIASIGIVPVIAISDADKAVPLAKALVAGGIPVAEVTFRTAQGEEAIRRIANEVPEILLGAGTVTATEQVDRALAAGAKFAVSPGLNPAVVNRCLEKGLPITPGCATPSEMEQALALGLEVVKFFPAEQAGGLDYLKAVSAPYSGLRFMPTGGINAGNLARYLANDRIIACGGSWMVAKDLIEAGDFDEITRLCREAVRTALGFELRHIGINASSEAEAMATAGLFEALFGFAVREGNRSIFAGHCVEVMKQPYLGKHGHIAVGTVNTARAMAHLERRGFTFAADTAKRDAGGKLTAIYLKDEIAGFAVHLVQK